MITHQSFIQDTIFDFVRFEIDELDRQQIIIDIHEFHTNGFIGNCELRRQSQQIMDQNNWNAGMSITTVMAWIETAVFKYYTARHFGVV